MRPLALPRIAAVLALAALIVAATLLLPGEPLGGGGASAWMAANSVALGDQDGAAVAADRLGDIGRPDHVGLVFARRPSSEPNARPGRAWTQRG
jgi:hypothetical protein